MVNFSETFDVKFSKKSKSCPKAQKNTLLVLHLFRTEFDLFEPFCITLL